MSEVPKIKFNPFIIIAAGFVLIWLFIENEKKKRKIKDLQQEIDDNLNLTKEIKTRLSDLIKDNKEIDTVISNELGQIVALLEIKQDNTAILKLAKIVENLLQELYKKDIEFKQFVKEKGHKTPVFTHYIEHAKNKGLIKNEDYHLLSVLKIIRNEEAHELDVKKEQSRVAACLIAGISIVLLLCKTLKKKKLPMIDG